MSEAHQTSDSVIVLSDGSFQLREAVGLPDTLDVLIVGGGPAGTAAAFRAKELGLQSLVIDADDVLSRIRDYDKDKKILPNYGPIDNMRFPKAGALIAQLVFGPTNNLAMHRSWKRIFCEASVPVQVGMELTGLERRADGAWSARCWSIRAKKAVMLSARCIVLALGRGVPRRFDIPGNLDGIAYRFRDAQQYVGRPVLVVGGGTSAAEAVIAISNAKADKADPTSIYWSYRGDKLPRVSRALADDFFKAYVGNGNVRYLPNSEPTGILEDENGVGYMTLRTDRRKLDGRPREVSALEFPKEDCVACIGEDFPSQFLESIGVHVEQAGRRKRATITPLMETNLPNVFLIGDTLSDQHLITDDFALPSTSYKKMRRPGNIKAALRDGVFVMEAIQQILAGNERIDPALEFLDSDPPAQADGEGQGVSEIVSSPEAQGPPPASFQEGRAPDAVIGNLLLILPGDGATEAQSFPIRRDGVTSIGRKNANVTFGADSYVSETHASIVHGKAGLRLRDDGSQTGVFFRLRPNDPFRIASGAIVRAGSQFLRFSIRQGMASVDHFGRDGVLRQRYELTDSLLVMGRGTSQVVLDPADSMLSKRHLAASFRDGTVQVTDFASRNGTFLKIDGAIGLRDGDEFRVGHQCLRVALSEDVKEVRDHMETSQSYVRPKSDQSRVVPVGLKEGLKEPALSIGAGECVVEFVGGTPLKGALGQSLLSIAIGADLDIEEGCCEGTCGADPIQILEGAENLEPPSKGELKYLAEHGHSTKNCRFACVARFRGGLVKAKILSPR